MNSADSLDIPKLTLVTVTDVLTFGQSSQEECDDENRNGGNFPIFGEQDESL